MKKAIVFCFMYVFGSALLLAQKDATGNMKEDRANRSYEATKTLIESGKYEFVADRLISSTGYSNSLTTNPSTLRLNGDQVRVYLPYFGELHASAPYQVDGGIKYKGPVEDYSVEYRDDKRRIVIKFNIDRGMEVHNFMMTVNKDGFTRVTVISSGRSSISYYGITAEPDEVWAD